MSTTNDHHPIPQPPPDMPPPQPEFAAVLGPDYLPVAEYLNFTHEEMRPPPNAHPDDHWEEHERLTSSSICARPWMHGAHDAPEDDGRGKWRDCAHWTLPPEEKKGYEIEVQFRDGDVFEWDGSLFGPIDPDPEDGNDCPLSGRMGNGHIVRCRYVRAELLPPTTPGFDKWIENPGKQPIPDGTEHINLFRSGDIVRDAYPETWDWTFDDPDEDHITHYAVAKLGPYPPQTPEEAAELHQGKPVAYDGPYVVARGERWMLGIDKKGWSEPTDEWEEFDGGRASEDRTYAVALHLAPAEHRARLCVFLAGDGQWTLPKVAHLVYLAEGDTDGFRLKSGETSHRESLYLLPPGVVPEYEVEVAEVEETDMFVEVPIERGKSFCRGFEYTRYSTVRKPVMRRTTRTERRPAWDEHGRMAYGRDEHQSMDYSPGVDGMVIVNERLMVKANSPEHQQLTIGFQRPATQHDIETFEPCDIAEAIAEEQQEGGAS